VQALETHTFRDVGSLCLSTFIDIIHCGAIWSMSIQVQLCVLISSNAALLLTSISYNAI